MRRDSKYLVNILYWLYLLFMASLVCCFRAVSSMSIGLILLLTLIHKYQTDRRIFNKEHGLGFFLSCLLFYVLQIISLAYSEDIEEGLIHVQLKSALLFVPAAIYFAAFLNEAFRRRVMTGYLFIVIVASLYCLGIAFSKYLETGSKDAFFYFELVKPFGHHAIQYSLLVMFGALYTMDRLTRAEYLFNPALHLVLASFLLIVIMLLSSKLVIAITIACVGYYLLKMIRTRNKQRWILPVAVVGCVALTFGVMFTSNPISKRFDEIIAGDISMINQDKFNQGTYFNGLQFRLIQWRFLREILNENNGWISGVGIGDGQHELDEKYIATDMYTGEESRGDHGFLGFNTHNQFYESLLQTGILGLAAYILIVISMVSMVIRTRNSVLTFITISLLAYTLNESVFETQYGMMIFLFIPFFYYKSEMNHRTATDSSQ